MIPKQFITAVNDNPGPRTKSSYERPHADISFVLDMKNDYVSKRYDGPEVSMYSNFIPVRGIKPLL